MPKFVVTPWEVKGTIDYDRLIQQFGLKHLGTVPEQFMQSYLFRRNIVFAQRDFSRIIKCIRENQPFAMMTGLMPSGKFHFGHKVIADQMILYQTLGARVYVTVADVEAYNSRDTDLAKLQRIAIEEYLTNYVALGLDIDRCDFYFQSHRSTDGAKANAYYGLASMLARHATFNEFKAVYGDISPAKIASSILQAADMLHPQLPAFEGKPLPVVIPVGTDQDAHIRLARDMAKRMKLHAFIPLSSTYATFLPGLKGGKMSSSDPTSYIALTDTPEDAARKVKKYAFSGGQETIEQHRKKGGDPDVDVAFQMLRFGLEPDDDELLRIRNAYVKGDMLSSELKKIAIDKIQTFLRQHHQKRTSARKRVDAYVARHLTSHNRSI